VELSELLSCVLTLAVMEVECVPEPHIMDHMLVRDVLSRTGGHEHVDIMILREIVVRQLECEARLCVLLSSCFVFEAERHLACLEMHEEGLVVELQGTLVVCRLGDQVVVLVPQVSRDSVEPGGVRLRLLGCVTDCVFFDVDLESIEEVIKPASEFVRTLHRIVSQEEEPEVTLGEC